MFTQPKTRLSRLILTAVLLAGAGACATPQEPQTVIQPPDEQASPLVEKPFLPLIAKKASSDREDPSAEAFTGAVAQGSVLVQPSDAEVPANLQRFVANRLGDASPETPLVLYAVEEANQTEWFTLIALGRNVRLERLLIRQRDAFVSWTAFETFRGGPAARSFVRAASQRPLRLVEVAVKVPQAGGRLFTPRGFALDGGRSFRIIDEAATRGSPSGSAAGAP